MLKREIKTTADGSKTLYLPEWQEGYHSHHGAIQEAFHVFIDHGLSNFIQQKQVSILEYGFGTGLNALITALVAKSNSQNVFYQSIEKYPIDLNEIQNLDYPLKLKEILGESDITIENLWQKIHSADWNEKVEINEFFTIEKTQADFHDFNPKKANFDLIYFDAFGKRVQPDLWEKEIFEPLFESLKNPGLLTTYASNGSCKRALLECGFIVEKKPGPVGKREMINAWKR